MKNITSYVFKPYCLRFFTLYFFLLANVMIHAQSSSASLNLQTASLSPPSIFFGLLTSIAGCDDANGTTRFATVTRAIQGVQNFKIGMTKNEMQTYFEAQVAAGYHQTFIQGYYKNSEVKYNAIFEKSPTGNWYANHAIVDADALNKMLIEAKNKGYRPRCLSGYQTGLVTLGYSAIFEKYPSNPDWQVEKALTAAQFQEKFNYWTAKGYCLDFANGFTFNGVDFYVALYVKETRPAWYSFYGMTGKNFNAENDKATAAGYYLKCLSHYGSGADTYLAIWEEAQKITLTGEVSWSTVVQGSPLCGLIFENENKFVATLAKSTGKVVNVPIKFGPVIRQGNIKKMTYRVDNLPSTYGYNLTIKNTGKYQTVDGSGVVSPKIANFSVGQSIYMGVIPAPTSIIDLNQSFCPFVPN